MTRRAINKGVFKEAVAAVAVFDYLNPREYLQALYMAAKERFDSYSYLKFAGDLGFSETNVVRLVITGERPLTSKAARRIADALDLHGDALRYWTTIVKHEECRLPAERERLFRLLVRYKARTVGQDLDDGQAEYFSEWWHPVVREAVCLPGFDGTPGWIRDALAFPLRLDAVRKSLDLLARLGYVRKDGLTYSREGVVASPREVDAVALVRYHQEMIGRGAEAITRIDERIRDIQAVTVRIPVASVPLLKAKIEGWTREILALEKAGESAAGSADVFQVNIQMFPFTRTGEEE